MKKFFAFAVSLTAGALFVASAWAQAPAAGAAGNIKVVAKFAGAAPAAGTLKVANPECARPSVPDETLTVTNGGVKNVAVFTANKSAGAPSSDSLPGTVNVGTVKIDQKGCQYVPHVQVVEASAPKVDVVVTASDKFLHNVHIFPPAGKKEVNQAAVGTTINKSFDGVVDGDVYKFKCDVHPWMESYAVVTTGNVAGVTKDDGMVTISGVAPGDYTLNLWHQKFGKQSKPVKVVAGQTAEVIVEYK